MQRGAQFLVGGLGATIVLFSAIIGLEVSVGTARSGNPRYSLQSPPTAIRCGPRRQMITAYRCGVTATA
jgi:hypothetical protein